MINKKNEDLWNNNIPFNEFLVIGNDGTNYGLMKKYDAVNKAQQLGFDLLCISPNAKVPVCKMFIYDRYRFEQKQKEKETKKAQKANVMKEKEIRLTVNIGENDLEIKAKRAREFLLNGDKVKVSLKYKGRENQYREFGLNTIMNFYQKVEDVCNFDRNLDKMEGNFYNVYLIPKKNNQEN